MRTSVSEQITGPEPATRARSALPIGANSSIADLFRELASSEAGLTATDAASRLARYGPNEPAPPRRAGPILQFLHFCVNPLVLILLCGRRRLPQARRDSVRFRAPPPLDRRGRETRPSDDYERRARDCITACTSYEIDGALSPFDDAARARCLDTFRTLSAEGFRVLAVAFRSAVATGSFTTSDERELVLAGFITFFDPPRADVAESIAALRADGVNIKIPTGDNELVTRHVCAQVGIETGRVMMGEEIERTGDTALTHIVEHTDVFARVSPAQKNRIIIALKRRKHVVGFLGDGINDAPSLHAADVGISVAGAVDVAKDAADIILLEPGLAILHSGIIEGRKSSAMCSSTCSWAPAPILGTCSAWQAQQYFYCFC